MAATPSKADSFIKLEGAFLWGTDWIDLGGTPPEEIGLVDFGNGPSAGVSLRYGPSAMFGQLSLRYFATSNSATATRDSIFGTTNETLDLWKRFFSVDADLGVTVSGPHGSIDVMAGVRYLSAQHNFDDEAITSGGLLDTYGLTEDRTVFEGIGPHFALQAEAPLSERVSVFGGFGAAVMFGQTRLDRYLELQVGTDPPGTSRDLYSGPSTAYAFDGQLGLTFALGSGNASPLLSLGYRIEAWWYTHDGQSLDGAYPSTSDVAIHHGPFLTLTLQLP